MKLNKTLIAAGVGLTAFVGLAIAQSVTPPQVSVIHPTDLIQVIPFGQPTSGNVYATPALVTSQAGYVKYNTSAISAGTYTFANSQSYLILTPGTTISTLTVILAANPSDGARECVWSNSIITTLVVAANTGQTINGAATALTAAAGACYVYSLSNLTWDRSGF
jgi:hypothetical protein